SRRRASGRSTGSDPISRWERAASWRRSASKARARSYPIQAMRGRAIRAALFDVGGTLLEIHGSPWRPLVLEAIRREFGARPWAEALYDADIRRPAPDDPYRQETNRWLSEWLKANGEELGEADVERVRGAFAAPIDYGPYLCE